MDAGIEGTEFNMTDCVHSPDATGFVPYCDHLEQPGHDGCEFRDNHGSAVLYE